MLAAGRRGRRPLDDPAAAPFGSGRRLCPEPETCREAALALFQALEKDDRFVPLFPPELDIVVWAVRAELASEASARARMVFDAAAERDLHLAIATFPRSMVEPSAPVREWDADEIACLRACVMKPEHREWMAEILHRLDAAAKACVGRRL